MVGFERRGDKESLGRFMAPKAILLLPKIANGIQGIRKDNCNPSTRVWEKRMNVREIPHSIDKYQTHAAPVLVH